MNLSQVHGAHSCLNYLARCLWWGFVEVYPLLSQCFDLRINIQSVSSVDEVIKVSLSFSVYHFLTSQFAEWLMERSVLLCRVQGHEPYAVYWVRTPGPWEYVWYLVDHAEYDRGSHLLCHVHWPCHCPHTVAGLFPAPVPGEGGYYAPTTHTHTHARTHMHIHTLT